MRKLLQLHFTKILLLVAMVTGVNTWGQASENFSNIPTANASSYTARTWTGTDGVTWNATAARTDQTLNGKAIATNATGTVTSPQYSGGMGTLTFNYVRAFTGTGTRSIEVYVNGNKIGNTIAVNPNNSTTQIYSSAINIAGNVVLELRTAGSQILIDDIAWTAYSGNVPVLGISGTTAHGTACPGTATASQQYTITNTGTVAAGVTVVSNDPQFVVSGLSSNTIAANGGTATYTVTFTPASAGPKTAIITVSSTSTGSNTPTSTLTGTGATAVAQAVTTQAATNSSAVSATFNGNVTALGTCPATIERGFVYSATAANTDPLVGGTGVIKVIAGTPAVGAYTYNATGLTAITDYVYKAYVYNGTAYSYGGVQAFRTTGTSPALTAATGATVDNPFSITFTDDAAWRAAITSITVGGTTLAQGAYLITNGQIIFTPAASTLLQTAASKAIVVMATGYSNATVTQVIGAGAASKLTITTQPTAPATNGGTLVTQPVVAVRDQYNNITSSTVPVTAAVGAGTWTLGGTTSVNAVAGTVTFAGLTATSAAAVTGATITFSATGLTGITSSSFNIPVPAPVNDNCTGAIALTVGAAPITGNNVNTTQSLAGCTGTNANDDLWYSFTTGSAGAYNIVVVPSASFDAVVNLRSGACNGSSVICMDDSGVGSPETITETLAASTTYYIRVYDYAAGFPSTTTFTISVSAQPTLAVSATSLTFGSQAVATASASQSFNLSGSSLTGAPSVITVNAPSTDFQVSNNGTSWATSTTIAYSSATLASTPVYVRFTPQTSGTRTGNITFSGGGVVTYPTVSVTGTGAFTAPVALAATNISSTSFTANWSAVAGASNGYLLDVSTSPTFNAPGAATINEGFETGMPTGSGYQTGNFNLSSGTWAFSAILKSAVTVNSGVASAQMQGASGASLTSPAFNKISSVTFYAKRNTTASTLTVAKRVGGVTTTIGSFALSNSIESHTIAVNETNDNVQIIFTNGAGVAFIDDISISYIGQGPSFVSGYNAKTISGQATTSIVVSGLNPATQYHYRVRAVSSLETSANSNVIDVTTGIQNIWVDGAWSANTPPTIVDAAIIASPYNTIPNGAFSAASLTVNTGASFTVASNTSVTIQNEIVNNAGAEAFVVQNNGNLLQVNNTVSNVNEITVRRDSSPLFRQDYTMWSSPVAGQNLLSFSEGTLPNRFYVYDTANNAIANTTTGLINIANDFEVGKGYLIRMPNDGSPAYDNIQETMVYNGKFVGQPNNGTIPVTLSGAGSGFNLIGNPYPSPIRITDFFAANNAGGTNKLEGTIWIWRKKNNPNNNSSYITINSAGIYTGNNQPNTTTDPQGIIRTGQGFIVKPLTLGGPTTIEFNNAMRSTNTSNTFFRTNDNDALPESHGIWLNLTSENGVFSQMYTGYIAGATSGFDNGLDSRFINDSKTVLASVINNEEYVIQGRALPFSAQNTEALQLRTDVAGTYTITLDHVSGLFAQDQDIYIKDNVTGTVNDLRAGGYTFATEAGTFPGRFEVVYANESLGTNNPVLTANNVVVYNSNNVLTVNSGDVDMEAITIYDVRGREIYSKTGINAGQAVLTDLQPQQQVLIVQITTANGKVSKKVVY